MAEKHVHKVYGSFPPWGKSVEFPAGGGGGNYVYFDTSSIPVEDERMQMLLQISYFVKETLLNGPIVFSTNAMRADLSAPVIAVGIDLNLKVSAGDGSGEFAAKIISLGEMISEYASWILDLPRLTEEEFYKMPTQFTFILNGEPKKYYFIEGMTWGEWIDSSFNNGNFSVHDANMGEGVQEYAHYLYSAIGYNEAYVKPTDLIQPDINYFVNDQVS